MMFVSARLTGINAQGQLETKFAYSVEQFYACARWLSKEGYRFHECVVKQSGMTISKGAFQL
jgi:hypothetical protein